MRMPAAHEHDVAADLLGTDQLVVTKLEASKRIRIANTL
jgi:hypothetical protein